jgi:hypothetical protein
MAEIDVAKYLQEIGGVFKFGSGVLGRSSIAVGILLVVALVAVWRLHSDYAILVALALVCLIVLIWFTRVMQFASKHPDVALLEGAEWSGYKKFEATAKTVVPDPPKKQPTSLPGTTPILPGSTLADLPEPDQEPTA